ncbi:hypothetical protein Tco_1483720 [Tanacetum coccineum]
MNNTSLMENVDSNNTPNSSDMYDNEFKDDQNADDHEDEHVVPADLIANLKLDIDENKKIQKQLRNANTSLAQELKECKSTIEETNRTLGESNRTRDRCFVALHDKEIELAMYKTFKDHTIENDTLERKLKETQASLAQKEHDIKEGLKLKAYENSVVKEKHDELVKQSLLTKSHYEGLVREKTKVITDLKQKEEKDLDKLIMTENKLKFLNEIVYKRNQSIQTIHMLAPKGSTFNGRPTFANPMYLKKAQSKKPCLYEILYDTSDLANRFIPDREETLTLEQESRSKLNKDLVKPYDYTKQNSLYETLNPRLRNIMFSWHMQMRELIDQAWEKHSHARFRAPTALDIPSRKSPKHVSFQSPKEFVGSNDMVHNYYLEEAKKKAQLQKDKALNTKSSVQQFAKSPNTANGNKLKPRNFNQQPRNWPPSMSSCVSNRTVKMAEPPWNQKPFLKSKDLACPTCKKCIYSANHDECILKYLSKVNSRAPAQKKDAHSHKTTKRNIPVEKKSDSKKNDRHIPIGQKFSSNKSSAVYLKTTPPRSGLTWKLTGRIFT